MDNEKIIEHIAEIEREIAVLPAGGVSKKNVHGNIYYYHRITQNGKRIEKYVKADEVDELISNIEKRKKLEKELKKLKQCMPKEKNLDFKTKVLVGDRLKSLISITRNYKKRECIQMLRDYIFKDIADKVFILYGLRRTGKTTLIRQIILELSESDFNKAAFIQITSKTQINSYRPSPLYRIIKSIVPQFHVPYFKVSNQERIVYTGIKFHTLHSDSRQQFMR